jgi:monooxygenase
VEHVDVIVVGAGLSGIGGACHLRMECPQKSFVILEGREAMGGTWDLFRYPGVRSDSDMYTLGYRFRPWRDNKAMADGPSILSYIRDTAAEYGVEKSIRYHHRVRRASWSSDDARWTIEAEAGPDKMVVQLTCNFLYLCTGYYDYENGYTPEWPGIERFRGTIVHPQKWPEDLDYLGNRVVVNGSGATAITLVPALAERAAHVTMLQRSPSYVVSRPAEDSVAIWLRRYLPDRAAYSLARWKNVFSATFFYNLARKRPELFKWMVARGVRHQLGGNYDSKHFTPNYNPWDQRLCFAPDADFFCAIREGRVSLVTDHIESFTEDGLLLKSGEHLDADIIVTATGLVLKLFSGMQLVVDGAGIDLPRRLVYKGMMLCDVPNFAFAVGYSNA